MSIINTCTINLVNKTRIAAPLRYKDENGKSKSLKTGSAEVVVGSTMTMTTNGDVNDVLVSGGVVIKDFKQMDRRLSYTFVAEKDGSITVI